MADDKVAEARKIVAGRTAKRILLDAVRDGQVCASHCEDFSDEDTDAIEEMVTEIALGMDYINDTYEAAWEFLADRNDEE
jgi:hypothetical protein